MLYGDIRYLVREDIKQNGFASEAEYAKEVLGMTRASLNRLMREKDPARLNQAKMEELWARLQSVGLGVDTLAKRPAKKKRARRARKMKLSEKIEAAVCRSRNR